MVVDITEQRELMDEIAMLLSAEAITRFRWDRVTVMHSDALTPGNHPVRLGPETLRVEVGILHFEDYEVNGERHRRHSLETLTFDYTDDGPVDVKHVPHSVADRVRAHIEKEQE